MIVEFASNGSLLEYLKNENHVPFDYSKRLSIALDVAKGMAFLERKRVTSCYTSETLKSF